MSRMLHATLPSRYFETLRRAAENADVTRSEFIRDWIRDLPEFKETKDWGVGSDFDEVV